MLDFLLYQVLAVVLCVGLLITIHEFGHFLAARYFGVKVLCFSVGFGKALWSFRGGVDGTEYRIGMVPLGGYVRMLDDRHDRLGSVEEGERAFNRQGPGRRAVIAVAGPLSNVLLAVCALWLAFLVGIEGVAPVVGKVLPGSVAEREGVVAGDEIVSIDGRLNRTWNEHNLYLLNRAMGGGVINIGFRGADGVGSEVVLDLSRTPHADPTIPVLQHHLGISFRQSLPAVVGEVIGGSAAEQAGLVAGDRIVALDDVPTDDWEQMALYVRARPGRELRLAFERDGLRREVVLVPRAVAVADNPPQGRIGVAPAFDLLPPLQMARARHGVLDGLWAATLLCGEMSRFMARMLWRIATLRMSSRHLGGPVTIVDYTGRAARSGFDSLLMMLAIISISIALFNMLPVPLLDGGHLLFCLIESLRGGPLASRAYSIGNTIGAALLFGIMGLAIYNDILNYFLN